MAAPDWGQAVLWSCHGARVARIARIFHQHGDAVDESRGPLELSFEDGRVLHLTTATNGEALWVCAGPWSDPFGDPGHPADEVWIREHGQWVCMDLSGRPEYAEAIGKPLLLGPWWLVNEHGYVAGVELNLGMLSLTFASWGDDEYVVVGRAGALPREWGMQRYPTMVMEA